MSIQRLAMRLIEGGTFTIGSDAHHPEERPLRRDRAGPQGHSGMTAMDRKQSCCTIANPRGARLRDSFDPGQPQVKIGRKVLKGGSHLCALNHCQRFRPVGWAQRQSQLIDQTFAALPGKVLKNGDSYQALLDSYFILTGQQANAAIVASRWIGGVFNNRAAVGQPGAQKPLVPVPVAEQRRALAAVTAIAFAPGAFAASESLLDRLQVQRRSFDSFGVNVDPKPHARALAIQRSLLDHMLHPNVLTRLTDSRRYGGDYPVSTYMAELTSAVFDADRAGPVNTYRQNLQIEYVTRLISAASGAGGGAETTPGGVRPLPTYDYVARSAALASLEKVKAIAAQPAPDAETRAHRAHIRSLIAAFERR